MNETNSPLLDNIVESKSTAIRLMGVPLLLSSGSKKQIKKQRKYVQNTIDDALRKLAKLSQSPNNPCDHLYLDFYEQYREHINNGKYSDASELAHELVRGLISEEQKFRKVIY